MDSLLNGSQNGKIPPEVVLVDIPIPEPMKPWSGGKTRAGRI